MQEISEDVWVFEKDFSMMGAELGNRMTVIRHNKNQKLILHSPNSFDETTKKQLDELGEVDAIITPNRFHGLFADEWLAEYPNATHYAVKNARENFKATPINLNQLVYSPWAPELLLMPIDGMAKLNEIAFFHPPSRTLILTDLCFNIHKKVSLWSRVFLRMNDAIGKFGPSRLMKSMITNEEKLGRSISELLEWDFDRIILSHGDIVEKGGKEKIREAFSTYMSVEEAGQ